VNTRQPPRAVANFVANAGRDDVPREQFKDPCVDNPEWPETLQHCPSSRLILGPLAEGYCEPCYFDGLGLIPGEWISLPRPHREMRKTTESGKKFLLQRVAARRDGRYARHD
jgi:hypothetical protein